MGAVVPWVSEKFGPAGRCIYGADHAGPFTNEHIIPFALLPKGGDWFLPEASCTGCACITKKFEGLCLGGTFGVLREQLNLKTRRKKNRGRPIQIRIRHQDGTDEKLIDYSAADLPKTCLCFDWLPPGVLRNGSPSETGFNGQIILRHDGTLEKMIPNDGRRIGPFARFRILDHARMLAKIAHCYAWAKCGPDKFQPMLLDVILGRSEYAPYLIGGDPRGAPPDQPDLPSVLHDIYPMSITVGQTTYLSVVIRLFAFWKTPNYVVIVGKQLKQIDLPKAQ